MASESPAIILHDSSGNEVGVTLDGAVYRLQVSGVITAALPAGTNILGKIGIDSAETGGLALENTLQAIQTVVTNIRDTAGIKKIVDALPAGTNILGKIGIDSANTGGLNLEATQTAIQTIVTNIRDTAGIKKIVDALPVGNNIIGQAKVTNSGGDKIVSIIDDVTAPTQKRFQVEAALKPGTTIGVTTGASVATAAISEPLVNGASSDMVVSGSAGTPVSFSYGAHPTLDTQLTSLRLVFSAAFIEFTGNSFGKGGGALANGVDVNIVANGGDFTKTMSTLNVNEDFLRLLEFSISQAGSTDVMAASVVFGGRIVLEAGSSDKIEVVIKDDLTSGARGITYFTATAYGIQE